MDIVRIPILFASLVVITKCATLPGSFQFGQVVQPSAQLQFNPLFLKAPQFGLPKPTYEIKVNDYSIPKDKQVFKIPVIKAPEEEDDSVEEYEDPSVDEAPSGDIGYDFFHRKKKKKVAHVVLHKHVHNGHVIHDHKHEGQGKHLHKHEGHEHHEHHHEGWAHHEHKHEGKGMHKHSHEGKAEHGHKHKGEAKHMHEHLGEGKHLHKHKGVGEHGHKHSAWADHGHKHSGWAEHKHVHKGDGKHGHTHWGDAEHAHNHEGQGQHKHSHWGHGSFVHEHEGKGKHNHEHLGNAHHDHEHYGKAYNKHNHHLHSYNEHLHKGAGYITHFHDGHTSFTHGDDHMKSELIDITPKKKNSQKIKEVSIDDSAEFEEFISSLRNLPRDSKPVYTNEDYEVKPKKVTKKPSKPITSYIDHFENFKANNYISKQKESPVNQPFNEDYIKFLSKYLSVKGAKPELNFRHGYSVYNKKNNKLSSSVRLPHQEVNVKMTGELLNASESSNPKLYQYNVFHGNESDDFPSMSYVSQVRGA